jgi:hypothetical protein
VYKLVAFFLMVFVGASIFSAVMEGGNGFAATAIDDVGGITAADLLITVDSTSGFLSADYIIIDDEEILYDSKGTDHFHINAAGRGYNGTTAAVHANNANVYTADASALNAAMGFNINATRDAYGSASIITIPMNFFIKTVPNIVQMNFSFMSGQMAIVGIFFFASGVAFIITLALAIVGGVRN